MYQISKKKKTIGCLQPIRFKNENKDIFTTQNIKYTTDTFI